LEADFRVNQFVEGFCSHSWEAGMENNRAIMISFGFSLVAFLSGCGGGQATPPPPVSVSLAPSSAQTVDPSRSVSFTSTVGNDMANKGVSWSVSGTGCAGSACGTLSNQTTSSVTYTAPGAVTTNISVKVTATSVADGTKSASGSITVVPPPAITTASLAGATVGTAYSAMLQASGGITPYNWTLTGGTLPPGLNVNGDGSISGSPTAGGNFSFTVQVADAANPPLTATANLSITSVVLPISITTLSLPDGTVDTAYKQLVQVTGGIPPYTWSTAGGSLPSWASLNSTTGSISGIPGGAGMASFSVKVADSETPVLTDTQGLTITIVAGTAVSDSKLSGHYAFLFNGFDDATGSPVAIAGSFTTDANGKIMAGVEDENGPGGPALNVPFTGTYNVGSDNRGAFTIITASGSKTYALVLSSINSGVAQKARFIEFDDTTGTKGQRGSGVMRLQDTTAFALSKITGPYAFGFEGQDATGKREAMAGSFSADGAGTIPTGIADQNIAGTASNPSLTGTYTAPSSTNGRATMTLNPSSASSLDLSAYVISANEFLVLTTNTFSTSGLISGAMFSQTATAFNDSSLNAPAVYYQLGGDTTTATTASSAEIGLLVPDGSGTLSTTYDKQFGSGITQNQTFTATYSVLASGRVTISGWYGDTTSALRIFYLLDKNKAFFLNRDEAAALGFVEPQSLPVGGFSNASFTGTFSAATTAPAVSPDPNACGLATLDGAGSFNQIADFSTESARFIDQTTSGAYSIAENGRGAVTGVQVTATNVRASMLGLFVVVSLLFGSRKTRSNPRSPYAMFYLTVLLAATLGGCPFTRQLVFYVVSPTKAVMMPEQSFNVTPVVSIIER
jgi:hypothetical protein